MPNTKSWIPVKIRSDIKIIVLPGTNESVNNLRNKLYKTPKNPRSSIKKDKKLINLKGFDEKENIPSKATDKLFEKLYLVFPESLADLLISMTEYLYPGHILTPLK
jgi:hypothetical protein